VTSVPTSAAPGPVLTPTLPATPTPFAPHRGDVPAGSLDRAPLDLPWADWSPAQWVGVAVLALIVAFAVATIVRAVVQRLYLVREHEELGHPDRDGPVLPSAHAVTAFVVAHAPAGLAVTLDLLARQQHPDVRVVVAVDPDDRLTLDVATSAARRHPSRVRVVPGGPTRTATALAAVDGDVVAFFAAGDRPHPRSFALVDSVLTRTGADAVQHASRPALEPSPWWSPRLAVERWWWSRSSIRSHGRAGFVPLSGSTLFVRHAWLAGAGGWDVDRVGAGLDLGVGMAVAGARIVVATSDETETVARAPRSARDLVRVRVHWVRGCLQVLGRGEWRRLRPTARRRALGVLTEPLVDGAVTMLAVLTIGSLAAVGAPSLVFALALVPLVPAGVSLVLDLAATGEAAADQGRRATGRERLLVVVGAAPSRVATLVAVVLAVAAELRSAPRASSGAAGDDADHAVGDSVRRVTAGPPVVG